MHAPAIADAEIDRLRPREQFCVALLVTAGKFADRPEVASEREEAPLPRVVVRKRNTGIVLDDGRAVGKQPVANDGEIAGVQQIGGALDQTVAGTKRLTEFQEASGARARVGEIGRE